MKKHFSQALAATVALSLSLALGACSSPQPKVDNLVLDFRNKGALALDVEKLNIVNRAGTYPSRQSAVMIKPSATDAVYQWARDRIHTNGSSGQATLIIKEASVTSAPVPTATGIDSWFTRQQSHRYTAKVEVDVEARSADGMMNAFATAHATRTATLPEDPTEAEKTQTYNDLMSGLMSDLDNGLEISMRQHLGRFMSSSR